MTPTLRFNPLSSDRLGGGGAINALRSLLVAASAAAVLLDWSASSAGSLPDSFTLPYSGWANDPPAAHPRVPIATPVPDRQGVVSSIAATPGLGPNQSLGTSMLPYGGWQATTSRGAGDAIGEVPPVRARRAMRARRAGG
jgi:hypothetical protein